jgi:hypothetical protein
MIITQVHLVLGIVVPFFSHNSMAQMSQVLKDCAIGMLTTGMSTTAVAVELNVNFSTNIVLENLAVRPSSLTIADKLSGVV